MKIEGKVIDGRVFISVDDTAAALRHRADSFDQAAEALGEPLAGDDFRKAVVYRAVSEELRGRADWLDVATVAHISS